MSEELHRHRHRHERRRRGMPQLIGTYWVEIVIAVGLVLGIFLLFEQMNIRGVLFGWLQAVARTGIAVLDRFGATLIGLRSWFGLSEMIAIPMLLGLFALIAWRVRWRMQRAPELTALSCPKCGGSIHRVHRHSIDRVISIVVPVRRYYCANRNCGWSGVRVSTGAHESRSKPSPE